MTEAQQLLQQLQSLLPQLQSQMNMEDSAWRGETLLKSHVSLLWAISCMAQCSQRSPEGKGALLAPVISCLPQVCETTTGPSYVLRCCWHLLTGISV